MGEADELSGVFAKVAGCHSARQFSADSSDALASLRFWVDSVPRGELVLIAIVGVAENMLDEVFDTLSQLGVPGEPPNSFHAFAAVGVVPSDAERDEDSYSPWRACHASSDVAYTATHQKQHR